MPILMQDGDDGIFGPGDRFYFYGQSPNVLQYNASDTSNPFQVQIHPYDTRQYYFVTLDANIHREIPEAEYDELARTLCIRRFIRPHRGHIAVICAGTSDLPVAREALVTLEICGCSCELIPDCGVAGITRLLSKVERLHKADVVIAVAGMEGALPSVTAGLVPSPVIAVPTSVGYGASFQGLTALLAMLNSCASGVTVVNIDNGFGAACAAVRILNRMQNS